MNGEAQPNLTLGEPPKGMKIKSHRGAGGFLWTIVLLQVALLAVLVILRPQAITDGRIAAPGAADAGGLKAVAMELEEKGLDREAADGWERYLDASPGEEGSGRILYRVGKLRMQAGDYEAAAAAFVRAELAPGADQALKTMIGPKMVECLRRMGRYGEVGRELSRRVERDGTNPGRGRTLATFAGEALTDADLDRMIEGRVDQMLVLQGIREGGEQRAAMLRQFETPAVREQIFQEMLRVELFLRRARELKLDQEEAYLEAKAFLEKNLLASRFQQRILEKVNPTAVDLEAYYQAHREDYREAERLEGVLLPLALDEDPAKVLDSVDNPEAFAALAAERLPHGAGGESSETGIFELERGRYHASLGFDTDSLFELETGEWTGEPIDHDGKRYLVLVRNKIPSRVPDQSEIEDKILQDYRTRKEQELAEATLRDLMGRYQVKILSPPGERLESGEEETGKSNTSGESKPSGEKAGKKEADAEEAHDQAAHNEGADVKRDNTNSTKQELKGTG